MYKNHYLYKITNLVNGHFYYGIHSTNNLDDGYMGSGTNLHRAYEKFGIENFKKEIIEFRDTREEISELEKEIVTEDLINNPCCYNIKLGGEDGWTTMGFEKIHDVYKNMEHQKGEKNSNYGTCWITNGEENKKIKKEELEIYLNSGWEKGRYVKNTWDVLNVDDIINDISMGLTNDQICEKYNIKLHLLKKFIRNRIPKNINRNTFKVGEKNPIYNKCWVNKDGKNKPIKKEELETYLNNGWEKGSKLNMIWISKDNISIMIKDFQLEQYVNGGWIRGRLNNGR